MEVVGYKCFNADLTNRYGKKFIVGKIYFTPGVIKFGNNGNGFHLCKNMEDTLRYFDAMNTSVSICRVVGRGNVVSYFDDYYGYYDMFAVSELEIVSKLTRDEIVSIGLRLGEHRVKRFLSGYKLNNQELKKFKDKFLNNREVLKVIEYYQENKLDAFAKRR